MTKPDGLVGTELAQSSETPGADLAVTALIELAVRYQDRRMGRPGRLEVVDAELGAAVVAALGDPAVAVDVVPELTEVRHVLRALAEHQQAGAPIPSLADRGFRTPGRPTGRSHSVGQTRCRSPIWSCGRTSTCPSPVMRPTPCRWATVPGMCSADPRASCCGTSRQCSRLGLAQTLVESGRVEEALAHFRELLRLNPGDNQGVRDLLLGELVRARRDDDAVTLLQEHKDDFAANWAYTWALVDFRNGRRAEAEAAAARAFEVNAYVPDALAADPDDLPTIGDSVTFGGPDEAIAYVEHVGDVWHATPGAVEWLRRETTKRGRGARRTHAGRSGGRPSRRR